jgi:hypothetical protein
VAVKTERDAILKRVLSTFRLLHDVVQLDLEPTKTMAKAAVATTGHESLVSDFRWEAHGDVRPA